jgi:hypothetical protein
VKQPSEKIPVVTLIYYEKKVLDFEDSDLSPAKTEGDHRHRKKERSFCVVESR